MTNSNLGNKQSAMKRSSYDVKKENEYVLGGSFVVGHRMHFQSFGTVSE